MLITRSTKWYRPYSVSVSNRDYEIRMIHFYDNNGIMVSTCEGWLMQSNGMDIESIELPVEKILTKRIMKFDGSVFIISNGKQSYKNTLLADLYIPAQMLGIHFDENVIKYQTQLRAVYRGSNDIYISVFVKSLETDLNHIRKEFIAAHKACDDYSLSQHAEDILDRIDKLKQLAILYINEQQRINNLTVADAEKL